MSARNRNMQNKQKEPVWKSTFVGWILECYSNGSKRIQQFFYHLNMKQDLAGSTKRSKKPAMNCIYAESYCKWSFSIYSGRAEWIFLYHSVRCGGADTLAWFSIQLTFLEQAKKIFFFPIACQLLQRFYCYFWWRRPSWWFLEAILLPFLIGVLELQGGKKIGGGQHRLQDCPSG